MAFNRKKTMKELEEIRKLGFELYAYKFDRNHSIKEVIDKYPDVKPEEKIEDVKIRIAGRIRSLRRHGKLSFAHIEDFTGQIQLYISAENVTENEYKLFQKLNVGDIVGVEGGIIKTIKGELSILVKQLHLLAKAMRTLPSKWYGLKDVEIRYRQRYVDLLMNKDVRDIFIKRAKIIQAMRKFLDERGFIEVETPVLQPIYGGALARPFVTHHNALDMNLYLRIADELYLKRLIVGGFEKVYGIEKDFRNEGIDTKHNPEFTMMEFYQAYIDYNGVMELTEQMISFTAKEVLGTTKIKYKEHEINLKPPWRRISMIDSIKEHAGVDVEKMSLEEMIRFANKGGLKIAEGVSKGELIATFFEEFVQPNLIQPTFITDYPIEVSPLAKKKRGNERLTERFEAFIGTEECGNGFSELNDPIDQRERFLYGMKRKEEGDEEAHVMDEDYVRALEYGLPPTGGLGIGIDRLTMLLTDIHSIRDVILFPTLRPEKMKKDVKTFGDETKDSVIKE